MRLPHDFGRDLAARAALVIAATIAAALALALVLAFLKFDQKLRETTGARMSIVAQQVRDQGQTGLGLGLALPELLDLDNVLKRAAREDGVLRIDIADPAGRILFSSDPSLVGATPALAGVKPAPPPGHYRQTLVDDHLAILVGLVDSLGRNAGDVVVRASLVNQRAQLDAVRGELLWSSAPLIPAALLISLIVVWTTVKLSGGRDGAEMDLDRSHLTLEPRLTRAIAELEREIDRRETRAG